MYVIKSEFYEKLLKLSGEGYPKRKVIEEYRNGSRNVQENTVRALAGLLNEDDWEKLVDKYTVE